METYKVIEGFENYSVSDHGNVKNNSTGRIKKCNGNKDGYVQASMHFNNVLYNKRIHVLVASAFIPNPNKKRYVDHIDHVKSNNNISNLRWASAPENQGNRVISINNTSGTKGVVWHKGAKKWSSRIMIDRKYIHLGLFDDLEDAKQTRIIKANEVFGVFTNSCEKII